MISMIIESMKKESWMETTMGCCLFAFPFWLANAALECLESSFIDDYVDLSHYAALGFCFPFVADVCPLPFLFFDFYFKILIYGINSW